MGHVALSYISVPISIASEMTTSIHTSVFWGCQACESPGGLWFQLLVPRPDEPPSLSLEARNCPELPRFLPEVARVGTTDLGSLWHY